MRTFAFLLLSLIWVPAAVAAEKVPPLDIYLLIGQSNMAGRAPIEASDDKVLSQVFLFTDQGTWELAANPLNRYSTVRKQMSLQRLSLGYSFAQAMSANDPDAAIGLVMNARGGTRIEEWAPGEKLFEEAVLRAKAAQPEGILRGILWHQGEGNSRDPDYLDKFSMLTDALRAELNAPELPIVVGQVEGERPVNAHLARVAEVIPHSACASSAALTTYDGTHFDTPSTRELGRRYAAAMVRLQRDATDANGSGGTVSLFDGKTFAGWEGDITKAFRIEDGVIVGGNLNEPMPRNEFLCTTESYKDFELNLQFKVVGEGTNSGVQFRSKRIPDHHEVIGYQADLGDPHWWGSIYDESRRNRLLASSDMGEVNQVLRRDDWNNYRIRCEGKRIRIWINGTQTVDFTEGDEGIADRGIIGLQIHSGPPGEARFKDITIRELL